MPATMTDDVLARWAARQGGRGLLRSTHACSASLAALDVARADLEVGCRRAEDTVRRIAAHFRRVGRSRSLLAFEAWGIQLESAPLEVLAEQVEAAVTGLRRVLALPVGNATSVPPCVLVLAPDARERRRLQAALSAPHRRVVATDSASEARVLCRTDVVDVLVVDVDGVPNGARQLLVETREHFDRTCAVALTSSDDPSTQAECFALGADLCFTRGSHVQVVATAVAAQLDRLARASEVAVRDSLTGLVNRTGFEEAHRRARADAARYREPLSIALLDLDRFKAVNDRHGHATGDRVLLGAATVMESRFREGDVVARWGGEEFAVLMPRTEPEGAVEAVKEVLERLAERTFRASDGTALAPVTFSAGVADGRDRLEKAMPEADRRLYRAKEAGRRRVEGPAGD